MITLAFILSLSLPADTNKVRQKPTQKIILNKLDSILTKIKKNEKNYSYSDNRNKRSAK